MPVIVSPAIAAAAGADRLLPLQIEGTPLLTRVVGIASRFPSVDGDLVVADRADVRDRDERRPSRHAR